MKLTKAKQELLDAAYDTLIQVCLYDRPLRDMEPYLADDVMNFGAGKNEITKTKTAFLKQIKNQKKLAAGLKMDFKIRPVLRKIINKGTGAIYTDDIVNTVWINEVENKLIFRLSFIFEYRQHKWIMVHSHTSTPDPQRSDDEVWPVEELKKRTAVLEKSLDEKIAELETKNRELEIETALERVRAVAMSMRKPEELTTVGEIIFTELKGLGFNNLRNTEIIIINDAKETLTSYYYSDYGVTGVVEVLYKTNPTVKKWVKDLKKANDAFAEVVIPENEMAAWRKYREEVGHLPDPKLNKAKTVYYYSYSIGLGGLSISTFKPSSAEQINILERFRNVFNLSYQRYTDIALAEAQAREAKIEAALERTRTQSMIMQHSKELDDTLRVFHEQVLLLGINSAFSFLWLPDEKNDRHIFWAAWGEDKNGPTVFKSKAINYPLDRNEPATAQCLIDWKSNEPLYSYHVPPAAVENYFAAWQELIDGVEQLKPAYFSGGLYYVEAFMKYGCFGVMVATDLTEDEKKILGRFSVEFERTYNRFLDLQKAEAQAREAQIEAALERVRSRSMGMQKSEDLKEVIQVVYEQFVQLNIHVEHTGFIMDYKTRDDMHIWLADKHAIPFQVSIPYFDCAHWNSFNEAKEKGIDFFANQLSFEEKNKFYQDLFKLIPGVPEETLEYYFSCPGLAISTVLLDNVGLYIENFSGIAYTDEENNTLMRFGKVFQQTYTRFLDLQKAETQAREAQIEAALERVRSRTMGMQQSHELGDVATVLFKELNHLVENLWTCGFVLCEKDRGEDEWWLSTGDGFIPAFYLPNTGDTTHANIYDAWKKGETYHTEQLEGEALQEHYDWLMNIPVSKNIFDDMKAAGNSLPTWQKLHCAYFSYGYLVMITQVPCSEEQIFKRFAQVFDQTYTRFLDLQKAEALAKESQIELGLERVRARAMAMQKSDELSQLVDTVFKELTKLDFALTWCIINIIDESSLTNTVWAANPDINKAPESYHMLFEDYPFHHAMMKGWKERKTKYVYVLEGLEKKIYDEYLFNETEFRKVPEAAQAASRAIEKYVVSFSFSNFGGLQTVGDVSLSDANLDILSRFGKVFDLTYTRFNDLKQAEAQARESQIQLALERVRARTMAMQHSDELKDAANLLFRQVKELGIHAWSTGYGTWTEDKKACILWMSSEDVIQPSFKCPHTEDPVFIRFVEAAQKGEMLYVEEMGGEELKSHYKYMQKLPLVGEMLEDILKAGFDVPKFQIFHVAYFSYGYLLFITYETTPEAHDIFKRLAKVFEQTYTRFLDLQKAEAQAKESQIQLALERVRARTMAMQRSDELMETAVVLFDQLNQLGENIERTIIGLMNEEEGVVEVWATRPDGSQMDKMQKFPIDEPVLMQKVYVAWRQQKKSIVIDLRGEELERYFQFLKDRSSRLKRESFGERRVENFAFFSKGILGVISADPKTPANIELYERFAAVFDQTYIRFLDLQKAEAQAREATIEAALEKVRGKAMAMHNSNDLSVTASMVFTELRKLGINSIRSGVGLLTKESRKVILYSATSSEKGDNLSLVGWAMLQDHPVLSKIYDSWIRNEDYFPVLKGKLLKTYYEKILSSFAVPGSHYEKNMPGNSLTDVDYEQHGHFLSFSEGFLYGWSEKTYTETEIKILNRFKSIIDLTFRRFIELQKSEANSKQAVKQAALDRIRADIASMRTINDLEKITPLVWNELTILGVPFIRCGVFIMDDSKQLIHTFLSTPDGKAIAAFHLPYTTPGNISQVLNHWHDKKIYIDHWDETAFIDFAGTLIKQGALTSPDQYLKTIPPGGFYLHFLPFLQGMLYVGNTTQLDEEEIKLIQSIADAFSTAYARYEDFNNLEAAKKQVDNALNELQATQKQLIQSEKMASLGELTAGIAHEIQNPLNFVNNFSEVNKELLEEMKDEMDKGNVDEAKTIANDVIANQEKINQHGKRADAIVKGMLQHSRSSNGIKVPTDINALADEYLRLAYHGLRAKDNTFNATLKTDFDETIGNINIIPQDIGRVILNLITNAFYAVKEKKKSAYAEASADKQYDPTVSISTKKVNARPGDPRLNDSVGQAIGQGYAPTVSVSSKKLNARPGDQVGRGKVEIKVHDNGNGIPQKLLDKIFQPFFTTKPTGQGTGLGLSLSYDIIKAHGGELKIETQEGEFAEFIILLPLI